MMTSLASFQDRKSTCPGSASSPHMVQVCPCSGIRRRGVRRRVYTGNARLIIKYRDLLSEHREDLQCDMFIPCEAVFDGHADRGRIRKYTELQRVHGKHASLDAVLCCQCKRQPRQRGAAHSSEIGPCSHVHSRSNDKCVENQQYRIQCQRSIQECPFSDYVRLWRTSSDRSDYVHLRRTSSDRSACGGLRRTGPTTSTCGGLRRTGPTTSTCGGLRRTGSPSTFHLSPSTCNLSPSTCHLQPSTCHLPPATFHLSPVTCHTHEQRYLINTIFPLSRVAPAARR